MCPENQTNTPLKTFPAIHINSRSGFTLVEVAVALVIIGLVAGTGMLMLRRMVVNEHRISTLEYMAEVRQGLLLFANKSGRLLPPGGGGAYPTFSHPGLGVAGYDAWGRKLKYAIHPELDGSPVNPTVPGNRLHSCNTLKTFIKGTAENPPGSGLFPDWPMVFDEDAGVAFPVAAVLVSPGSDDADGAGWGEPPVTSYFDGIVGEGDNYLGTTYLRHRPTSNFDDLLVYIGPTVLYDWLQCN